MLYPSLPLLITYGGDQGKAQLFRPCMCIICFEVEDAPQSSDRGRVEIEGVYSICPLSWTVRHNFVRDGERGGGGFFCTPHSPGWANFSIMMECTPEAAIATLWLQQTWVWWVFIEECVRLELQNRVRILGRNPDKSLESFSPCYSVTSTACLEISNYSNSRNLLQFL